MSKAEKIFYLVKRLKRICKDTNLEMEVSVSLSEEEFDSFELKWFRRWSDISISNYNLCDWKLWICIEKEWWLQDAVSKIYL